MTATLRAIREAVETRLKAITGAGYHVDLSTTDAVKVGRYLNPWKSLPCACLWLVKDQARPGPTLSGRSRVAEYGCLVWIAATAADPKTREGVVEDVHEDLMKRFRASADRSLGGIALDVMPGLTDFVGAEVAESADSCVVIASISVEYREAA